MRRFAVAALAGLLATQSSASLALEPGSPATCSGPIKKILLIKRKPGTTHEQFRDYYENHHAPLALRLLGPFMLDYRRNFIQPPDPTTTSTNRPPVEWDVVTELWFKNREDMAAMYARARSPEIRAQIDADEKKFMDQPANRQFSVDECQTKQ